jgi:hypothetical protein
VLGAKYTAIFAFGQSPPGHLNIEHDLAIGVCPACYDLHQQRWLKLSAPPGNIREIFIDVGHRYPRVQ